MRSRRSSNTDRLSDPMSPGARSLNNHELERAGAHIELVVSDRGERLEMAALREPPGKVIYFEGRCEARLTSSVTSRCAIFDSHLRQYRRLSCIARKGEFTGTRRTAKLPATSGGRPLKAMRSRIIGFAMHAQCSISITLPADRREGKVCHGGISKGKGL